jgi:hypothetical protein
MTNNSPLNILIAFPYFRRGLIEYLRGVPRDSYRLIVDSGAFTAWNIGKQISLDEYCRFLDSIQFLGPFNAVQLDVFGNPELTWKNFLIMKQRGYDVMPVFTRGDTLERLDEMYSYTDYIMFGGITIGGKNINYVKWFMERNKGRKIHWLGFCNVEFVKHFKPYSIDSSSWSSGGRFGNLHLYKGFGQTQAFNRKKLLTMPEGKVFEMARRSGITRHEISLLRDAESWIVTTNTPDLKQPGKGTAMLLTAISFVHRAVEMEKNLGTKFYLACGTEYQLDLIFSARNFLIERGIIDGQHTGKQSRKSKVIRKRKDRLPNLVQS